MDFISTLQKLRPEGTMTVLGSHQVFRYSTVTPAHVFESVVIEAIDGRLIELTSRDGFDSQLASFLLDQLSTLDLPDILANTIRVTTVKFPKPWKFDVVVVVPPAVARRFEYESEDLQRVTYWALPAFEGEFTDGANSPAFWYQINRKDGWNSCVVLWNRIHKTAPAYDR